MRLDDHLPGQTGLPLETVNILREVFQQQALVVEQFDERVRNGRSILARRKLPGERVERTGIVAEEADIEDGFGVGEVQVGEIGVDTRIGGPEVWDAG
jgi:hypothetical protein